MKFHYMLENCLHVKIGCQLKDLNNLNFCVVLIKNLINFLFIEEVKFCNYSLPEFKQLYSNEWFYFHYKTKPQVKVYSLVEMNDFRLFIIKIDFFGNILPDRVGLVSGNSQMRSVSF